MNNAQPRQANSPYVFIGGSSRVFALDKLNGNIIWQVQLKKGFFRSGKDFVTLSEGQDFLYAFTHGIAFCLDKYTGNIVWQKLIKDLKYTVTSMAVDATILGGGGFDGGSSDAAESDGDGGGDSDGDGGGD
ncbi:MAG: hypothetical protein AB8C95_07905 [Phycisphaeraceae bacterium]